MLSRRLRQRPNRDNECLNAIPATDKDSPELTPPRIVPGDAGAVERHVNSASRLQAVQRSGMLDSPPEESFDSLTRLASRLLKVPASFITIVDAGRDFYKSQVGFPQALAADRELVGRTFCHYTLAVDGMLVIEDTQADQIWNSVPTVQTMGVRAYAGVPLKLGDETIGSFCVIDTQPRQWSAEELEILRQLALSAGRELSLRSALSEARDESVNARALARSREEIVAVVAHDLRTPLQILHLSTTLLQQDAIEAQQPVVRRMVKAIEAMTGMANGLLSSGALLASSAARNQAVSAELLARDAVSMMNPIAERAAIALVLAEIAAATITVDYAQMLRVLGNLIGNSIKYSPAGSSVVIAGVRQGDTLLLTVADQGKGMTAQEQGRAFDSGWQGAEGMVRGDGAGLGLSIVRTLVTDHGGRVEIASEPGRGTTLTVFLPCQ